MLRNVYLFMLIVIGFSTCGQSVLYDWSYSVGGNNWDSAEDIAIDMSDNIYVTGRFTRTCDFDPGPNLLSLSPHGQGDLFVQKVDSLGNLDWAVNMGGTGAVCEGVSVVTDNFGGVYITGYFNNSVDFDPSSGQAIRTSNGFFDVFLVKLDTSGSFQWVHTWGSGLADMSVSVDFDGGAFIYVAGHFKDTVDFDNGIGAFNIASAGASDAFIAKYDILGNFYWAKGFGGLDIDEAGDLSADASGNIYMTGQFKQTADFNPDSTVFNLSSIGGRDVFVVKINGAGEFGWAKSFGSVNDYDEGISISGSDHGVYLTGWFSGVVDFDPGQGVTSLVSNGGHDIFIEKLDTSGSFAWARSIGAGGDEAAAEIMVAGNGEVYVIGNFEGTVNFGTNSSSLNKTSQGFGDAFVLKIDGLGSSEWVQSTESSALGFAFGKGIVKNGGGDVYLAGTYVKKVDFDPGIGVSNMTSVSNSRDIYCLKLSVCQPNETEDSIFACNSYTWINGVTYNTSNTSAIDTLVSINGCDSIILLNLVIQSVDTSVSTSGRIIESNQLNGTYQWLDCENGFLPITGEVNRQFNPAKNGSYAVAVSYGGCVDTSACIQTGNVDIEEFDINQHDVELYPNPASDVVNYRINKFTGDIEIKLFNSQGMIIQQLHRIQSSTGQIKLPVEKGIYWIEVSEDGRKSIVPVLKE